MISLLLLCTAAEPTTQANHTAAAGHCGGHIYGCECTDCCEPGYACAACGSECCCKIQPHATIQVNAPLPERKQAPPGWKHKGRAPADHAVTFTLALKQRNLGELERAFRDVSDPTHDDYGKFMTKAEITELVAPHPSDVKKVGSFLTKHGAFNLKMHGDAITAQGHVSDVEEIFATEMHTWTHKEWKREIVRQNGKWTLPKDIAPLLEFATGVADFPMKRPAAVKRFKPTGAEAPQAASTEQGMIVPSALKSMCAPSRPDTLAPGALDPHPLAQVRRPQRGDRVPHQVFGGADRVPGRVCVREEPAAALLPADRTG